MVWTCKQYREIGGVFVCSGCHNKIAQTGRLHGRTLLIVLEAGIQDQGVNHLISGRNSFPVLQIAVFSLYILTCGVGGGVEGRDRVGRRQEERVREEEDCLFS